jgi:hypothetical protein
MTRTILRSSAKIKNLQLLIELHRSLMNTLKKEAPGQSFAAHRKLLEKVGRESTQITNPILPVG